MRPTRLLRADADTSQTVTTPATPPSILPRPRGGAQELSGSVQLADPWPAPNTHPEDHHLPDVHLPAGSDPDEAVTAQPEYVDPPSADGEHPADSGTWALVRAAQAGDMEAYGELFERYFDVVFRFILFRTSDRTLAEDLTSETFVRALRRISSVSYQGRDIGAWFVTIARNLIFDHVKSSRYRLEQSTGEMADLSPSTSGPEQQVLDGATTDELLRCVAKLNPDQQECIQLRFLQGLSVAETAQIMDRNEGAVKALQHRAIRRLGQLLPEGIR